MVMKMEVERVPSVTDDERDVVVTSGGVGAHTYRMHSCTSTVFMDSVYLGVERGVGGLEWADGQWRTKRMVVVVDDGAGPREKSGWRVRSAC